MATKLEKSVTRESTEKVNEREIVITVTEDQKVSMKLKGMKSGEVNIPIIDLYNQLAGTSKGSNGITNEKGGSLTINRDNLKKGDVVNPTISLYDLRSKAAISTLDYETKAKFDGILKSLIDDVLNPVKNNLKEEEV